MSTTYVEGDAILIKNKDVPLVLVTDGYFFEPHDEAEEHIVVVARLSYQVEVREGENVTAYTDAVLRAEPVEGKTTEKATELIAFAKKYAAEKNYRLQIEVDPEDYE